MDEQESHQSFEEALEELERTVLRLEEGELTLDEALQLYEKGQKLAASCSQQLEQAALKVARLTAEGGLQEMEQS